MYVLGLLRDFQNQKTTQKAFVFETNEHKYGNLNFSKIGCFS